MSNFHFTGNPASPDLVRDNGDGTVTERTYQSVADRLLAERTQGSDSRPSLLYQERTVEK